MYEELVKRLRTRNGWALNKTLDEAADAIEELSKPKWIPIKSRPMDDEEREFYKEYYKYAPDDNEDVIYSNIPDNAQEVLTCSKWGHVSMDTFYNDYYGCYFEENGDMDGIVAWMPLPKPYKAEDGE